MRTLESRSPPLTGTVTEERLRARTPWLATAVEAVATALFTLYVAWPFLGFGGYVTGFDTVTYSGPNHVVTMEAWRDGRLPLWNDAIFEGIGHLANPQVGALYPLRVIGLPLGTAQGLGALVAVHLAILATGTFLLVRWRLGLRAPAGLVASAAVVGSGVLMARVMYLEQLVVLAWAPILLVAVDAVVRSRRPLRSTAALAMVSALVLLAGHPQIVFMLLPLAGAWAVFRAVDCGQLHRLGAVAGGLALGGCVAAVQLVPTFDLAGRSVAAQGRSLASLQDPRYVVTPGRLAVTLLGDVTSRDPGRLAGSGEACSFFGAAVALLALLGVVVAARERRTRVTVLGLAVSGLVALVLAFGPRFLPYRIAYEVVPGFDMARVPARWTVVLIACVGVLAAYGCDAIARRAVDAHAAVVAAVAFAVPLLGFVLLADAAPRTGLVVLWFAFGGVVIVAALVRPEHVPVSLVAVLVPAALVVIELGLPGRFSFARRLVQESSFIDDGGAVGDRLQGADGRMFSYAADAPSAAYLVESLRPNANALFGIRSVDGYDGGVQVTTRWAEAMRSLTGGTFDGVQTVRTMAARPFDPQRFARLGVRWAVIDTAIAPAEEVVPGWSGPVVAEGTLELWENPTYGGEAIVWYASSRRSNPREIADALTPPAPAPAEEALVEPGGPVLACTAPCPPDAFSVERSNPGHLVASVEASGPALVALAEQYDPGWRAAVGGERVPVVPVDGLLVGVVVPAGAHTIELVYRPPHWTLAQWLTVLGVLVLVALVVVDAWLGGRTARQVTDDSAGRV